jgi:hypothetical protein
MVIRQGKKPLAVCVAKPNTPQGSAGPTPEHPRPSTALEQTAGPWRGHDGSYVHTHFNVRAHSGSVAHSHAPNITRKHGTHDTIYCTNVSTQGVWNTCKIPPQCTPATTDLPPPRPPIGDPCPLPLYTAPPVAATLHRTAQGAGQGCGHAARTVAPRS